jgi:hypothetical protein
MELLLYFTWWGFQIVWYLYKSWPNNDTGAGNVFVAKSSDDGKTFSKTIVSSTPNKEGVIDQNTSIAASIYVCVTWWTNESGDLESVSRASK